MLKGLPKLTQSEADFANLLAAVPDLKARALAWIAPAAEALSKLLNLPCSFEFKRVSSETQPAVTGSLLGASWPPQAGQFWVEFDTKVLQNAVYTSIAQTRPDSLSPALSDLERGVAMYLLARVFEGTKESFQLLDPSLRWSDKKPMLCVSLGFKLGDQNSFLNVWVSEELIHSLTALHEPSPEEKKAQAEELADGVDVPLRVNLTSVELTPEELGGLSEGDIIVLEGVSIPGPAKAFLDTTPPKDFEGQLAKSESGEYTFTI
jgi:flagellar motor switch/type III secretory pathway protein FliN